MITPTAYRMGRSTSAAAVMIVWTMFLGFPSCAASVR